MERSPGRISARRLFPLLSIAAWSVLACAVPTAAQEPIGGVASGDLPLWEVSKDGRSIHLLGSVHMLRRESYPLDQAIYAAFDRATVVAFEIDLGNAAAAAPVMMMRGMYADGRTLRTELPAPLFADLERRMGAFGLPLQALETMEPWLIGMTLNSLALQRLGYSPELGVDMHFFERARSSGKRVVALETIEDQIDVFDGLGPAEQVALLESTLDEIDTASETMERMSSIWATGDVDRLAEMMNESMADQPALLERVLHQRNRNWIPRIEALLESGDPAIVIVGMGHMVGDRSVTELLRERGYTVRRVERVPAG